MAFLYQLMLKCGTDRGFNENPPLILICGNDKCGNDHEKLKAPRMALIAFVTMFFALLIFPPIVDAIPPKIEPVILLIALNPLEKAFCNVWIAFPIALNTGPRVPFQILLIVLKQLVTTLLIPKNIVLNIDNSVFMTLEMTENTGLRTEFQTACITLNAVLTTLDIMLKDVVNTATIKSTAPLRGPFSKLAID